MSALLLSALAAGSSGQGALYVDDVFSTYLYTGNSSTQTINNGIDLAGKGGAVWLKNRDSTDFHEIYDTNRGAGNRLMPSLTNAQNSGNPLIAFNSNGFTLNTAGGVNVSNNKIVSWTFRQAEKFFDVVTYTGNGVAGRQIAHGLGAQAGFVTVKATSTTGDWNSYHRSATGDLKLNATDAQTASRAIITAADASTFTVSGAANTNGVSYVAYLWAHDPSAEGIIQCGSFTTNVSGITTAQTLGWEPQYLMVKAVSSSEDWKILDVLRGWTNDNNVTDRLLNPNTSGAENTGTWDHGYPTATGFVPYGNSSTTYIYLAIRRPNKPPTSGAEVFAPIASSAAVGTKLTTSFPVDMQMTTMRPQDFNGFNFSVHDSLRGVSTNATQNVRALITSSTSNENASTAPQTWAFDNTGFKFPNYYTSYPALFLNFCRAPGFFDVVCDAGTGAVHAIAHNLTKSPDLIIRKSRSAATQWEVWHSALAATEKLVLNSNAAKATDATAWGSTLPAATQFTVGTGANVNANAATFVTYLFATLAGISKVGSYTGNGSNQTIDCWFSAGARFVLIKRTDAAGDWYVWDTARGIVAANDPHLSLNTTAAEVTTDDSVDPDASGFIVNQNTATNINVNGGSYIFLAIA